MDQVALPRKQLSCHHPSTPTNNRGPSSLREHGMHLLLHVHTDMCTHAYIHACMSAPVLAYATKPTRLKALGPPHVEGIGARHLFERLQHICPSQVDKWFGFGQSGRIDFRKNPILAYFLLVSARTNRANYSVFADAEVPKISCKRYHPKPAINIRNPGCEIVSIRKRCQDDAVRKHALTKDKGRCNLRSPCSQLDVPINLPLGLLAHIHQKLLEDVNDMRSECVTDLPGVYVSPRMKFSTESPPEPARGVDCLKRTHMACIPRACTTVTSSLQGRRKREI